MDYAVSTVEVTDRRTGEIHEAKVFVGVLAVSNYTFVDLTRGSSPSDPGGPIGAVPWRLNRPGFAGGCRLNSSRSDRWHAHWRR